MELEIRHCTRYAYEDVPTAAALRLKLFPPAMEGQQPLGWKVGVNGKPLMPLLSDSTGDRVALWHCHGEVDEIEIVAEGSVSTADTTGVLRGLEQTARPGIFLRQTPQTEVDEPIREMAEEIGEDEPLARLHALSEAVHEAIDYRKGATDSSTTAAEAMALGAGVCQDQVHVFLAAAREMDIPARYVAGYLFDPDTDKPSDETHAWAEAFVKGLGWVGFDITNQLCPTDLYVRLSCGLDAADAAPIRGVLSGTPEEEMKVEIAVSTASQSQSQQ